MTLVSLMRINASERSVPDQRRVMLLENCDGRNAEAGRRPIRLSHPGVSSRAYPWGTWLLVRTRFRYIDGGSPTRDVKRALKLPRLEQPTSMQTSVIECCPTARRCLASSIRESMRN